MHRCVGAFYAPRVREGKQILQNKTSKSMEWIRGYTKGMRAIEAALAELRHLAPTLAA
jgi:hypothetical protein